MDVYGMDSEVLEKAKQEMGEIAKELNRMAQADCEQVRKNLLACWMGENAESYCKKLKRLEERMANTAKEIFVFGGFGILE